MRMLKGRSPGNRVRFRPGFGLAVARTTETGDPTGWGTPFPVFDLLKSCKKLRIVQFRVSWTQLEASDTPGLYNGSDWDKIDQYLDDVNFSMADGGPRDVSILLNTKLFGQVASWHVVPDYMRAYDAVDNPDGDPGGATYSGGEAQYDATPGFVEGKVLRFDNANVQARFTALANEIGRRYKDNPRVHIIGFPESSYGQDPALDPAVSNSPVTASTTTAFVGNDPVIVIADPPTSKPLVPELYCTIPSAALSRIKMSFHQIISILPVNLRG